MEIRSEEDAELFYERAPLPEAADPFAVADVEGMLVRQQMDAGRSYGEAVVWVRARLRQLAQGWGLQDPDPVEVLSEGVTAPSALYLRRAWQARPLESYEAGDKVRWWNGKSWIPGVVITRDHQVPVRVSTASGVYGCSEKVDLQLA